MPLGIGQAHEREAEAAMAEGSGDNAPSLTSLRRVLHACARGAEGESSLFTSHALHGVLSQRGSQESECTTCMP